MAAEQFMYPFHLPPSPYTVNTTIYMFFHFPVVMVTGVKQHPCKAGPAELELLYHTVGWARLD